MGVAVADIDLDPDEWESTRAKPEYPKRIKWLPLKVHRPPPDVGIIEIIVLTAIFSALYFMRVGWPG